MTNREEPMNASLEELARRMASRAFRREVSLRSMIEMLKCGQTVVLCSSTTEEADATLRDLRARVTPEEMKRIVRNQA